MNPETIMTVGSRAALPELPEDGAVKCLCSQERRPVRDQGAGRCGIIKGRVPALARSNGALGKNDPAEREQGSPKRLRHP